MRNFIITSSPGRFSLALGAGEEKRPGDEVDFIINVDLIPGQNNGFQF